MSQANLRKRLKAKNHRKVHTKFVEKKINEIVEQVHTKFVEKKINEIVEQVHTTYVFKKNQRRSRTLTHSFGQQLRKCTLHM